MFTEGLDENAINWIKQGSDVERKARSPLTDKLAPDAFPISPSAYNISSHALPPLKFYSGLLATHNIVAHSVDDDGIDNDDESVTSDPFNLDGNYSEEELGSNDTDLSEKSTGERYHEETFGLKSGTNLNQKIVFLPDGSHKTSINRGSLKESLRVELPQNNRRFTDSQLGIKKCTPHNITPGSNNQPCLQVHWHTDNVNSVHFDMLRDGADLGTPSAPPIVNFGEEGDESEVESTVEKASVFMEEIEKNGNDMPMQKELEDIKGGGELSVDWRTQSLKSCELRERENRTIAGETKSKIPYWQAESLDNPPLYSTSGQNAWQTLIAYDACIRLCLYSWARGCTEAPEFLRDECLVLRNAFGLHKYLLQPRGMHHVTNGRTRKSAEETFPLKIKKVVGKIRVEVRKLRIISRRKLKRTHSQRSMIYMQAGADYVRYVSSLVKSRINYLGLNSFSLSEEPLLCLLQLKSSTEDAEGLQSSAISLHPGSGDYHVFFPESQRDALLVEIQDSRKNVHGQATIPISSLNDNHSDRTHWWPIYHDDHECVGKVQLSIGSTITSDDMSNMKSCPVFETVAYDLLLEAAMRAQHFHSRNLRLEGSWKWLLTEFADYYGVSDSYTKLRYLSHVMNVVTPTKNCLKLVYELLLPVIKARCEKVLSRQERSILLDCETQVESLLANVFENYKSLDENSQTGIANAFGSIPDSAPPALAPAVQVYTLLHDILSQDAQAMLKNYLQTATVKRCRKHTVETDEFLLNNFEGLLLDPVSISTSYLKMKNLCMSISSEIKADIKIHNQHILPSSIDLSNITAAVYSTELCTRLRAFLASCPPSGPALHVTELLIAVADFERDLESWHISSVQGGVDSRSLFHDYIIVWVQEMQLNLLDLCKAEKVPWSGVTTNHSTSPFAEQMYEKIKDNLDEYQVVINRWPQYLLSLENAVANVERAIIKALEKQYNDILTPLKDSIPKRLNMQVQKLTRRQSAAFYAVPNELGIFLNTIKRFVEVLHPRIEDILRSWSSYLPTVGDGKALFGDQMNGITVMLRTKYKNYMQGTVEKLVSNMQSNRSIRLKRILEETKEEDREVEVRERMLMLSAKLVDSISNLHEVFTSRLFVVLCRGLWDKMGQIVLKFLEGRKENRVWYKGSYHALGILDDTFASQMQQLQGNALQEKDLEPPRSVVEARSILSRDTTNTPDPSSYIYF